MDNFSLHCFLVLAERRNFTKAAAVLNVSQPTLSRIIASLEDEIGVPLFIRSKRGISLTNSGQELSIYADSIVRSCEYAMRRARAAENQTVGKLSLGFLPAMCMDLLPTIVQKVEEKFPELELILEPHNQAELIHELNEENLDIALLMDSISERMINCEKVPFYQDEFYLAVDISHPLSKRNVVHLDEIANEHCLFYRKSASPFLAQTSPQPGLLAAQYEAVNKTPLTNTSTLDDLIALFTLIRCRQGVGILPTHLQRLGFPNVQFIRIELEKEKKDFTFRGLMCWHQSNKNPLLEPLKSIILEVGGSQSIQV